MEGESKHRLYAQSGRLMQRAQWAEPSYNSKTVGENGRSLRIIKEQMWKWAEPSYNSKGEGKMDGAFLMFQKQRFQILDNHFKITFSTTISILRRYLFSIILFRRICIKFVLRSILNIRHYN